MTDLCVTMKKMTQFYFKTNLFLIDATIAGGKMYGITDNRWESLSDI